MGFFRKSKMPSTPDEIAVLMEQRRELESQMNQLESFLEEAPQIQKDQFDEKYATIPPPQELEDLRRERIFHAKLCRNELRNERRYQAQSGVMVALLLCAVVALFAWALKIAGLGF